MARGREKEAVIPLDFAEALKAARERKKWTTTQLGEKIGKSDAIISMYEGGLQLPPKTTLESLQGKLGKSLRAEWQKVKPAWDEYKQKCKEARGSIQSPSVLVSQMLAAMMREGLLKTDSLEKRQRLDRIVDRYFPIKQEEKEQQPKKVSPTP